MTTEKFSIERITEVTPEVLAATEQLVTELHSSNQVSITENYLHRITDNPDNYWLAARQISDHKLIGMASLFIMPMPTNVRSSLENVVVAETARGQGIGVALCLEAKRIAGEQGVNTLRAAAFKTNTASKRMLEKAGFVIETSADYYELDIYKGPRF